MTTDFEDAQWPKAMQVVASHDHDPLRFHYRVIIRAPTGAARKVRIFADDTNQKRDYLTADAIKWIMSFQADLMAGVYGKPVHKRG